MPRLRCPVLVIHGRDDELVPYAHGQRLFAAARQPKAFLDIPGGHNAGEMLRDPAYRRALSTALDAVRGAPSSNYSQ